MAGDNNDHPNIGKFRRSIYPLISSRLVWVAMIVCVGIFAGTGYWLREPLAEGSVSIRDNALSLAAVGIIPIIGWIISFIVALVFKRSLLYYYRLWLGTVLFILFTMGLLSYFEPYDGPLSVFNLRGDVSLGGNIGTAITGDNGLLGGLTLTTVFITASLVTMPRFSIDVFVGLGRLIINAYVYLILIASWLIRRLRPMYNVDKSTDEPAGETGNRDDNQWSRNLRKTIASEEFQSKYPRTENPVLQKDLPNQQGTSNGESKPNDTDDASLSTGTGKGTDEDSRSRWTEPLKREPTDGSPRFNRFWNDDSGDKDSPTPPPVRTQRKVESSSWSKPPLKMLVDASEGGISSEEMDDTSRIITDTMSHYGVEVEIGEVKPGPTVTMYGLIPGWIRRQKQVPMTDGDGAPKLDEKGRPMKTQLETKTRVKVDSIIQREKDLALALRTPSIRIETPVMGKSLVGIEVPNPTPQLVTLRNVIQSDEYTKIRGTAKLPVPVGKGSEGETIVIDLAKMPHLLVAGSTGSGKSVFINTIISSLLIEKSPAEVRLLLIDPKRVELTPFNGVPHLLEDVVVETDQVVGLLSGLIREMMDRYRKLEEMGVRNIDAYNQKAPDSLPYIVTAVDELADLMMTSSVEVEQKLCRLAQLGRATGIHLVVATQRPSVDVLTGLIKANFPSRVSFALTSQVDSRTILDTAGAEKLLGKGDMLYQSVDMSRAERVQGVFISDDEIEQLVTFWKRTPTGPMQQIMLEASASDTFSVTNEDGGGSVVDNIDEMLNDAIELANRQKKISTSMLQRRLRIGYPRAARLMDELEEQGIVGPSDGSRQRDVIIGHS